MNAKAFHTVPAAWLLLLLAVAQLRADEQPKLWHKPDPETLANWRDMRFGMFIHWGPVSLSGREIGWSRGSPTPIDEYDNLYKKFNPTDFNADQWVATAKAAGAKYIMFTTKHHDGFCMWDTKLTDYNIIHTPFKRDVVKELAEACKAQGIAFCIYHSICDWRHPDYPRGSPYGQTLKPGANMDRYVEYLKGQLKELLTNYGPVYNIWFDGEWEDAWTPERAKDLGAYVYGLQPKLIVNNRLGKNRRGMEGVSVGGEMLGDYDTPEQRIGGFNMRRPWETSMTICEQWAWKPNDIMKPLSSCLTTLIRTAGGDGNLLFNVGPMPNGQIKPRQVERFNEIGQWLSRNGQSIYATRGGPYKPSRNVVSTRNDHTVYLHILGWPDEILKLPALPAKIIKSSVLTGGKVELTQTDRGIEISVPKSDRQEIDTLVVLELDKPTLDIAPIDVR